MIEPLHMAALVPALALVVRGPSALASSYLLVALAFGVSWVGDSVAWALGGSWAALYMWVPVQVGLVLLALVDGWDRPKLLALVLCAAALSAAVSYPDPEVLVITMGSTAIVLLAKGDLRAPLYLYFGVGTLLYLMMVSGEFMTYWYGYQASRVGAFVVFAALVFQDKGLRHGCGVN
ncbi:hypothetical protein LCGC14_1726370 [marine sediment metagenome]|uniref:Uncharacterized protein n=1 Tax=marine sediment metagenome TaxID=412755 RepID=A0A0F9HYL0_9ZZZZ